MIATIVILVAIAAFAFFLELRSRRRDGDALISGVPGDTRHRDDVPVPSIDALPIEVLPAEPFIEIPEPLPMPAPAARAVPSTISTEDDFARQAAEALDHWERTSEAVEQAHREIMRPMLEQLERARQLVEDSGVGTAACDLVRIMWHWPVWSRRHDWRLPMPIEGFQSGESPHPDDDGELKWFRWKLDGERFRLSLAGRSERASGVSLLGDLRLWVNEYQVLHLDVSRHVDEEPECWMPIDVSALRAGPWMVRLNEFAGRLRGADRQWVHDRQVVYFGEKTRNIAIG